MTTQALWKGNDMIETATPDTRVRLRRHGKLLSPDNLGDHLPDPIRTGVIPSMMIEGFLLGQPELHQALAEWIAPRFPGPSHGKPYTAVLIHGATAEDLRRYASGDPDEDELSLLLDITILFSVGPRDDQLGDWYDENAVMHGGLLIRRRAHGGDLEFSTHT